MNIFEFNKVIEKLEITFSPLEDELREICFERLKFYPLSQVGKAVDFLLDTHRFKRFPFPAEIIEAIEYEQSKDSASSIGERAEADFCERCNNVGIYLLGVDSPARFCDCIKGRKKEVAFRFFGNEKEVTKQMARVRVGAPPHKGLREFNPLGFWEDTKEEHEMWMAEKRAQIDELKKSRKEPVTHGPYSQGEFEKEIEETLGNIAKGQEENEVPF